MFPAQFRSAAEEYADMMAALEPKPVVYSPVACRCCGGGTVECEPNTVRMGRDDRRHVGTPYVRVTSYRFWCDGCEVMTWRRSR